MQIYDFIKNYNLHDSFFEDVSYDEHMRVVVLNINFAFWMQKSYVDGNPENGIIRVVFHNVREYSCNGGDPTGPFVGILGAELAGDGIIIKLLDDETNECFDMRIVSDHVEVSSCLKG